MHDPLQAKISEKIALDEIEVRQETETLHAAVTTLCTKFSPLFDLLESVYTCVNHSNQMEEEDIATAGTVYSILYILDIMIF